MPSRRGLTMIEVLVVVAIAGVLFALVAIGVSRAWDSARRVRCASNLRSVSIALHQYLDNHRMYPAPRLLSTRSYSVNPLSVHAFLLPFVESSVADSLNLDLRTLTHSENANRTVASRKVAVFLCPSEANRSTRNCLRYNLGFTHGLRGPFRQTKPLRPAELVNGSANVAFFSERVGGSGAINRPLPETDIEMVLWPSATVGGSRDPLWGCTAGETIGWFVKAGEHWLFHGTYYTAYNHNLPPGSATPSCELFLTDTGDGGLHPPRSNHSGGVVNVLFGDGRVEVVSTSVDPAVWRRWGSL